MSAGYIDFKGIKEAAAGRWCEIITALTPLPDAAMRKGKKDHPCPICNGKTVLWPDARAGGPDAHGRIACRNCTDDKPTGDGIATVAKFGSMSQGDAAKRIADYLGLSGSTTKPEPEDIIAAVARDKCMPLNAFRQFDPKPETRGRAKTPVARVAVYNGKGEAHSYFDFAPGQKGWCARGNGMSGAFFPGRLPQPGEVWHIVEGCKDAAALIGQGFLAAGMPGSQLSDAYAPLFRGVHVVFVPDLDVAGQLGAQKSGGRLQGIAASVKVARMPGEILEKAGADVRDTLRREGGDALLKDAIDKAEQWHPREGEVDAKDGRPDVLIGLAFGWAIDQVTQHLGQLGWATPWIPARKRERLKLYQRGGQLIHVVSEPTAGRAAGGITIRPDVVRIRTLPPGQIAPRITDACQLICERETSQGDIERVFVPPPRWLIDGIASRGEYGPEVRSLAGIITAPTIRADGSVLQSPGYDEQSRLLYRPLATFPTIPDKPTKLDAQQAADELLGVVKDFPFVADADRSAWLAMVLSQIGRDAITGCVPLFALVANTRGSGKSLAADAASVISFGRPAARKGYSADDNEMRKAITAVAIEALPFVLLDNLDAPLGGASLDAALTATTWSDRVLGSSATTGDLPLRAVWAATGNNLRFAADTGRRVLPIRMASPLENPEDRTDVEHSDLLGWVHDNRPRLAVAALTLLRAYFVAGCPKQPSGTWGSFEAWSAVVRGAIVWAGLADPMVTRETARADDHSTAIVRGLIDGLREVDEDRAGITTREIVELMNHASNESRFPTMRETIADIATTRGAIDSRRLGCQMRKYRGRVANGWQIVGNTGHGGVIRWSAKPVSGGDGCDGGDDSLANADSKPCVSQTRTHIRDTHTFRSGHAVAADPPSPPSPPSESPALNETKRPCPRCGRKMVIRSEPVGGYVNLDCPNLGCGHVLPAKVGTAAEVAP